MNALVILASENLGWPDAVVLISMLALASFVVWVVMK